MYFSFQHEIDDRLWEVISKNYENENFTNAIQDAIFYMSELLREKSDVDLDGVPLIGKVFGGKDPFLKINKLKTESEKNEQKGIENILRGIYQAIRNPRSHEKYEDDKATCDTFIVFLDYIIGLIERSKARFDFDDFSNRVFDSDFVESEEYADLMINEVPEKKLFDTLVQIFNQRKNAEPNKLCYIINSFLGKLSADDKKHFLEIASEVLKRSNDDHDFRVITTIFQNSKWEELDLAARLRAENRLLKSVEKGLFDSDRNRCKSGALGTWLTNIIDNIHLKDKFNYLVTRKLSSEDYEELEYLFRFFRNSILSYDTEPSYSVINAINKGLKRGDKRFYDLVSVEMTFGDRDWTEKIKGNYEKFEEKDLLPSADDFDDDIPFGTS